MTTVLVVDDSALVRKVLRELLEGEGMTVRTAKSGRDALAQIDAVAPDVVTLDIQMPGLDGLAVLHEIMTTYARPVVMISVLTNEGSRATVEALALGAVDYIGKPDASISLRLGEVGPDIVHKVRRAARSHVHTRSASASSRGRGDLAPPVGTLTFERRRTDLVLIGSSTGGPAVLSELIGALPGDFPPVVIAQHLPASFTQHLSNRLDRAGEVRCQEVGVATPLERGRAYVGRGDADVLVARRGDRVIVKSVPPSPSHRWHPSVDRLVRSGLEAVPAPRLIGVMLSGMGDDGVEAMSLVRAGGGRTIAESEDSAVVWGMPGSLVEAGGASAVFDAELIAEQLRAWVAPTGAGGGGNPRDNSQEEIAHVTHAQDGP